MTVLTMPDGAVVDFGDRSRAEITTLIAQKHPELFAQTPTERMSAVATEGSGDPAQPRPELQAALDAKAEHDPRGPEAQSLKPNEFELSVGTEIAHLPARFLGALGDIIGVAKPIGAMIGNEARKLTGKEPLTDLDQVEDPLGLSTNIPTSEGILNAASKATGVELHQPQGPWGVAGTVVGGALVGGPRLMRPESAIAKEAGVAAVADATKPAAAAGEAAATEAAAAHEAALAHPARAKTTEAITAATKDPAGRSAELKQTFSEWLADPQKMAPLTPVEREFVTKIASGQPIETLGNLIDKIRPNHPVWHALALLHLGPAANVALVGAGRVGPALKAVGGLRRERNAQALQDIVSGSPPPAVPPIAPPPPLPRNPGLDAIINRRPPGSPPAPPPPPSPMVQQILDRPTPF